jgi:hypothetical protein
MHQIKTIHEELEALSPFWTTIQSQMPYEVPAHYFEMLPSMVRAKIETEAVYEELELVAPLLNTIPKQTGYQIPVSQDRVPLATTTVKMFTWSKIAAAAGLIGIMVLGNYFYTSEKQSFDYSAYIGADHTQIIETISDSTLLSYMDVHEKLIVSPDVLVQEYTLESEEALIEKSSDQELLEYIQSSN